MKSKVAIIKCESYDEIDVYNALKKGINLIGNITKLIPIKDKILLKPNLLVGKEIEKAVTTHPAIFNAIIKILKENKYKKITYGDSPGFGKPQSVAKKAGLKDVADKHKIKLADFTTGKTISFPKGHQSKQFDIATGVLESDSIISLSKMKTHMLCKITGAVKNQLGCVHGLHKAEFHAKFPDAYSFSKMLIDLNLYLKPKLYIMDAIVAMEGNGPNAGDPTPINCILISQDPVALDTIFCKLINLKPELVPTNVYGEEFKLGTKSNIEIVGDNYEELIDTHFKVDRNKIQSKNSSLVRLATKSVLKKPYIIEDKCIKCGICIKACPLEEKALSFKDGKDKSPVYDYDKCIRCFCCQEMCPEHAIDVKTPFLGKLIFRK